jgi:hypothetical protein
MARTLAARLGVKEGSRVVLLGAPAEVAALLDPLPALATVTTRRATGDVVLAFATTPDALRRAAGKALVDANASSHVWLCYPKVATKTSALSRDVVWQLVAPFGWRPVAQVSVDDTWSALRFRPNPAGGEPARPPA